MNPSNGSSNDKASARDDGGDCRTVSGDLSASARQAREEVVRRILVAEDANLNGTGTGTGTTCMDSQADDGMKGSDDEILKEKKKKEGASPLDEMDHDVEKGGTAGGSNRTEKKDNKTKMYDYEKAAQSSEALSNRVHVPVSGTTPPTPDHGRQMMQAEDKILASSNMVPVVRYWHPNSTKEAGGGGEQFPPSHSGFAHQVGRQTVEYSTTDVLLGVPMVLQDTSAGNENGNGAAAAAVAADDDAAAAVHASNVNNTTTASSTPDTEVQAAATESQQEHRRQRHPTEPGAVAIVGFSQPESTSSDDGDGDDDGDEEAHEGQAPPDPPELLFNATLVREEEVVEAKPALEGFQALLHNRGFRVVMVGVGVIFVAVAIVVSVLATRSPPNGGGGGNNGDQQQQQQQPNDGFNLTCGTITGTAAGINQKDYRGFINTTASGKPCQAWSSQKPQPHSFLPEYYPDAGLDDNYCRSPTNYKGRAWCIPATVTGNGTDPIRELCNIPACEEENETQPEPCGTMSELQADYRGPINFTENGKACMHWDHQVPHTHVFNNISYPQAGLDANYCRNPEGRERAWCFTTNPETRWEYCNVPSCDDPKAESQQEYYANAVRCHNCTKQECGSEAQQQADYRGTINTTTSNRVCMPWSGAGGPHNHIYNPGYYPRFGLEENYCRNVNQQDRAWCFTMDPLVRWEYCDVPVCADDGEEPCGTEATKQTLYKGTMAVTISGRPCAKWSDVPSFFDVYAAPGYLAENYCRNPDNTDRAWCYTNATTREREYCDVPYCEDPKIEVFNETCGKEEYNQRDYRGNHSSTIYGKECQPWAAQKPHYHGIFRPTTNTYSGLDSNYCRNPDNSAYGTWCFTSHKGAYREPCNVPKCSDLDNPKRSETCGTVSLQQEDYRGMQSRTVSGRTCQAWTAQTPHEHIYTPVSFPLAGLEGNSCRNPSGSGGAWCYTTDPGVRWEDCLVPRCEEEEQFRTCGTRESNQNNYRGNQNVTASGRRCQAWKNQEPHQHKYTPDKYPLAGLEANYCRAPDGGNGVWCYTQDADVPWELCSVPFCIGRNDTCGTMEERQADYRGEISKTISNLTCQAWSSQEPHSHRLTPTLRPQDGLEGNFCRNPGGDEERAWCFTSSNDTVWESCDVPYC